MNDMYTVLGELTPEEFLRDYWQKKPLLIKGGFPNWETPVEPDELAGLACEPGVDARLVLEQCGDYPWQVRYGPFSEDDLTSLPDSHWSLLVRRVDQWVPAVAELKEAFRFVPSWRLDDVMVSFAANEGGVGAHIDNYDVFLIQGYGTRRWEIGEAPLGKVTLKPLSDISILEDFEPAHVWTVEPGDVLYLPPRVAHAGVALENCMTFSVGFRAPAKADIVEGYSRALAELIDAELLYTDPDLSLQDSPAEITDAALERVKAVLQQFEVNTTLLRSWFGKQVTQTIADAPLPEMESGLGLEELVSLLEAGTELRRTESVRTAFVVTGDDALLLFVNGEEFHLSGQAAKYGRLFADNPVLGKEELAAFVPASEVFDLINSFLESNFLYLAQPEE